MGSLHTSSNPSAFKLKWVYKVLPWEGSIVIFPGVSSKFNAIKN